MQAWMALSEPLWASEAVMHATKGITMDIPAQVGHLRAAMIDTLAIYEMLHAAGFKPQQAEAITRAIAASKGETSELKAKRDIEQRGASTALAVEQCSVRLHESIRRSTRDMIQFIAGGHILLLLSLIALVDFSKQ